MTQEEKDTVNAALLLEEKINERVWAAIEANPQRLVYAMEYMLRTSGPQSGLAFEIMRLVKDHIRPAQRYELRPGFPPYI